MIAWRRSWTKYSRACPRGSGYCEDQGEYQKVMRRWKLFGITIWQQEIDREEIPSHVSIARNIFGHYDGQPSKFQDTINKQDQS